MHNFVELIEFNILAIWMSIGPIPVVLASLKYGADWAERITLLLVGAAVYVTVMLILIGLILVRYPI